MRTLIYSGAHDAVEVPDAGDLIAERDKPVEVPDAVAKRLLEQDTWAEAKPKPAPKKNGASQS